MKTDRKTVFLNGLIYKNPLLVLLLGICPALSVTARARTGLEMGLAVLFVVTCSNIMISAFKRIIPYQVRIPCFMVIIASFVTLARYLIAAYIPALEESLGVYLPLMVVNCVIFGRAEGFACRNSIINSAVDGLGTGLGYTLALTLMGSIRELLGSGTIFGVTVKTAVVKPLTLFLLAPGGFMVLGVLVALTRALGRAGEDSGCSGCPMADSCAMKAAKDKSREAAG